MSRLFIHTPSGQYVARERKQRGPETFLLVPRAEADLFKPDEVSAVAAAAGLGRSYATATPTLPEYLSWSGRQGGRASSPAKRQAAMLGSRKAAKMRMKRKKAA